MNVFLCILKTVAGWLILMLVGTNLIGFVVRGFYDAPPAIESSIASELFARELKRMKIANAAMTLLGIIITATYLFALFYFWSVLLTVAAAIIMASRIPDLIWEIHTGNKVTVRTGPKGLFTL